jgi:hypothetical protein
MILRRFIVAACLGHAFYIFRAFLRPSLCIYLIRLSRRWIIHGSTGCGPSICMFAQRGLPALNNAHTSFSSS